MLRVVSDGIMRQLLLWVHHATIGVSREKCWEGQRGADNYWIRHVGIMSE